MPLHPLIPIAPALSFTFFAAPPSTATLNVHNGSRSALLPPGVQDAPHPQALDSDGGVGGFERYTWFSIDDDLVYLSFYEDWGPLNIAMFYRFCLHVHHLMEVRCPQVMRALHPADVHPHRATRLRISCCTRAVRRNKRPTQHCSSHCTA
jgi:cell division cycle 14